MRQLAHRCRVSLLSRLRRVSSVTPWAFAGFLALVVALPWSTARGADSWSEQASYTQALDDLRTVGRAMWEWSGSHPIEKVESADGETSLFHINPYPLISADELERLLVPDHLEKLPRVDPWGRPYEFRLLADGPRSPQQGMAVRSGGPDGRLSGETYVVGSFDPSDQSEDLVWVDGYFVRWPQRKR